MSMKNKIIATTLSGLAIVGIVAATTLTFPRLTSAQTDAPATATTDANADASAATTTDATTSSVRGKRNGPSGDRISPDKYLAEALGITEDELQTAQTTAREAAIKQAVTDGLITQEQADAMLNKTEGQRGVRTNLRGVDLNIDKYLAEALGITVDELNAAQEKAAAAKLAQAVTDGRMTQEQADLVTARQALQQYITDQGLYEKAVTSAVKDGVITQAQADAILTDTEPGAFGFGGMGHGGRGGHGGHGSMQGAPDTSDTQTQDSQP